jgi:transcriptional regulator with XRE-family HTH domain
MEKEELLNNRKEIGEQLRELRRKKGFTSDKLGLTTGINPSLIRRIERGESSTGIDLYYQLLKALGAEFIIKEDV